MNVGCAVEKCRVVERIFDEPVGRNIGDGERRVGGDAVGRGDARVVHERDDRRGRRRDEGGDAGARLRAVAVAIGRGQDGGNASVEAAQVRAVGPVGRDELVTVLVPSVKTTTPEASASIPLTVKPTSGSSAGPSTPFDVGSIVIASAPP